jgi:glycosyltransferase involved in cell wall biosynthesis
MKNSLFFSVIIPTYNRSEFIVKTLQSVLLQTYTNFEIIIVDDGSTDKTEQTLALFLTEKTKYYKIENGERAAARNFGVGKSKGDYVTFLDSDDLLYSNYLANAEESLLKYKHCPFFHLAYEIKTTEGKTLTRINKLQSDDLFFITKGNPLSCLGVFIRKDVVENFSFNEDRELSGSEDWELWLRIIANFGIKTDNRISASLINHVERSVHTFEESKLVKRKELALKYAFQNKRVRETYGKNFNIIDSYADGYISLHLALSKNKKRAWKYLLKSIRQYPPSIFEKRFLAIIKHLFFR